MSVPYGGTTNIVVAAGLVVFLTIAMLQERLYAWYFAKWGRRSLYEQLQVTLRSRSGFPGVTRIYFTDPLLEGFYILVTVDLTQKETLTIEKIVVAYAKAVDRIATYNHNKSRRGPLTFGDHRVRRTHLRSRVGMFCEDHLIHLGGD